MRITTRYFRARYPETRSVIKAYSDTGDCLVMPYPYLSDDPHWVAAYSLAKTLDPSVGEIVRDGLTTSGWAFRPATHFGN